MDQRIMKRTRRNRTVQRELKPWRCVIDLDFKRRWKMKHRDKTDRIIKPEMKITVTRSKIELRTGNARMNNMEYMVRIFLVQCMYVYMCGYNTYIYIYVCMLNTFFMWRSREDVLFTWTDGYDRR